MKTKRENMLYALGGMIKEYMRGGKMDGEERGYARGSFNGDNGMRVMKETDPKKSRKYSAYDTGGSSEKFPKIDIEKRDVVIGRRGDGSDITRQDTQFFLDGKPVSSQQAAKSYKMSQEGVQGGPSFNDFVGSYMEQYFDERRGGGGGRGMAGYMPQTRSRVESKKAFEESEGIEGLMLSLIHI